MKSMKNTQRQAGFGALEVMIALIIGAVVIIGAVAWYQRLDAQSKNGEELTNISSLITSVRQLKTASGYGTSGTNLLPVLRNAGGIPDTMQDTGGANGLNNAWSGAVAIQSNGTTFTLSYAGLSPETCIFLATKSAGSNTTTSINGGAGVAGEVDSITANTQCNAAQNTIAWTVR